MAFLYCIEDKIVDERWTLYFYSLLFENPNEKKETKYVLRVTDQKCRTISDWFTFYFYNNTNKRTKYESCALSNASGVTI